MNPFLSPRTVLRKIALRPSFRLPLRPLLLALVSLASLSPLRAARIDWTGLGTTQNFTEAANWSGSIVPGSNDIAVFSGISVKNCTINANLSIKGLEMNAGYTGTVTQAGAVTLQVRSTGDATEPGGLFLVAAGTFVGGTGLIAVSDGSGFGAGGGVLRVNGGTFNGGAQPIEAARVEIQGGTLSLGGAALTTVSAGFNGSAAPLVQSGGTFQGGTGSVTVDEFTLSSNGTFDLDSGSLTVERAPNGFEGGNLNQTGGTFVGDAGNVTVVNALNLDAGTFRAPALLVVRGSLDFTGSVDFQPENGTIRFSPASSLTVRPNGKPFSDVEFVLTQAPQFQGASVSLAQGFAARNVTMRNDTSASFSVTPSVAMELTLSGSLSLPASAATGETVFGGSNLTVSLAGASASFSQADSNARFESRLKFTGTGVQTLSSTDGQFRGFIEIDKPSGVVELGATLTVLGTGKSLAITRGVLDLATSNLS